MEDVLSVYARPYDENFPVICMDEKPVQLFANARKSRRSKDGRIEYEDNEYIRNGTAAIFLFSEPLNGWRFADAQEHRTREDWAKQIKWLLDEQYPNATKVVLVMDNLNTHNTLFRLKKHSVLPAGLRFTTRLSTEAGWTWQRSNSLLSVVSALVPIVFQILKR